jgi:hypothetical protein
MGCLMDESAPKTDFVQLGHGASQCTCLLLSASENVHKYTDLYCLLPDNSQSHLCVCRDK